MVLFLVSKYRKHGTMESFVSAVFLYSKSALAALYYFLGYSYLGWYLVSCICT